MKKVTIKDIGGKIIKDNATYLLKDNAFGNNLVLSSTMLRRNIPVQSKHKKKYILLVDMVKWRLMTIDLS